MTKSLEMKICRFKGIAEKDINRDSNVDLVKKDPKSYGYSKCLKCDGYDLSCPKYKQLLELKFL